MKRHVKRKHNAVEANVTRNSNESQHDENFNPEDVDIENVPFDRTISSIDNVLYTAWNISTKLIIIEFFDTLREVN